MATGAEAPFVSPRILAEKRDSFAGYMRGSALAPVLAAQPVKHVLSEMRLRFGHARVVEVRILVVTQANPLHDGNRPKIGGDRERDDLLQIEIAKAEAQQC